MPRDTGFEADLVVANAEMLITMDAARVEHRYGWVSVSNGVVVATGSGEAPVARRRIDASGCLVTPGLINTHHHIFQNLTRSYAPSLTGTLFDWLKTLYPLWACLDDEAVYVSTWIGLAELALGGCTTTTDHMYVHPRPGFIDAQIVAAREVGLRFHPTRGSMSLSEKDGGLPPDSVVQNDDDILSDSERLVATYHDRSPTSMLRLALAPCSPFSVTPELMRRTAELAERLDVRLHTHLAEDRDEDGFCLELFGCRPVEHFENCGWGSSRSWVAHCIQPNEAEIARLGAWGTGAAHCPSSNLILATGLAPVRELRSAGVPVGIGCDGSSSADSAHLWTETRNAMLLGKLRGGPGQMSARDAMEMATLDGARCLGRAGEIGELTPGACADITVWPLGGVRFAGALSDPVEGWLRCGPSSPRDVIVNGNCIVTGGEFAVPGVDEMLARHETCARSLQRL